MTGQRYRSLPKVESGRRGVGGPTGSDGELERRAVLSNYSEQPAIHLTELLELSSCQAIERLVTTGFPTPRGAGSAGRVASQSRSSRAVRLEKVAQDGQRIKWSAKAAASLLSVGAASSRITSSQRIIGDLSSIFIKGRQVHPSLAPPGVFHGQHGYDSSLCRSGRLGLRKFL